MTKTTFVPGSPVDSDWLNSIQNLVFDDQDLNGHYPRLDDEALSNEAGNLKPEWQTFRDTLKVTAATGLTVSYAGGSVTLQDGTIATIAPGQISLSASATNYIFVNAYGIVQSSTLYPIRGVMLAQATTSSNAILGQIQDLRPRYRVSPIAQSLRIFGGSGSQGDYTLNSGTDTLSGEYYFNNFTVAAGATLTISGAAQIYCAGSINIAGTINVTAPVQGGPGIVGQLYAQTYPNRIGGGLGGGAGINAPGADPYSYFASPLGSGGAGAWTYVASTSTNNQIITPSGGNGGGALILEAAGSIAVSGAINANGNAGQGHTTVTFVGGAALSGVSGTITGGGGGSGGLIWLRSLRSVTATAAAQLSVKGGAGGTCYPNFTTDSTAGGGGGGYVVCVAPTVNLTGASILLSGGASSVNGAYGSVSGGSFGGRGGASAQAGQAGQLIVRNVIPV